MDSQLHSIRAELQASGDGLPAHQTIIKETGAIVEDLSDALVATLSLVNVYVADHRSIGFAGDAIGAIRRAFGHLETLSTAHSELVRVDQERVDRLQQELEDS
jgi:hypothetical protein